MSRPKNRDAIKKARDAYVEKKARNRSAQSTPLFSYGKWRIVGWDQWNMRLIHEDDDPGKARWYSSLQGALYGLQKEIGFYSKDVDEAVASWDRLSAKISTI